MDARETNRFLTWLNQHDSRVQNTGPAVDIWLASINGYTSQEIHQAVLDHHRLNEDEKATPGGIRKIAAGNRERAQAAKSALTAGPSKPDLTERDIRQRVMDRPEFKAAFERGVVEGNAERAYNTKLRETGSTAAASQAAQTVRSATK